MNEADLVSIITPSYNSGKFICAMIDSILAQTYTNWELLITDDCSSDNSCQLIQEYCERDPRIKLYQLSQNSGAGVARNNSLQHANGKYIAFCDSDDLWLPEKLEQQIYFMKNGGFAVSHTSYLTCDSSGKITGIVVCRRKETDKTIKKDDKIGFLTLIYDVGKIGKTLLPDIRKRQDWGLKIKLLMKSKQSAGMKQPLSIYRISPESLSRNKVSLIKYNIRVYEEILRWSPIRATLYFLFVFLPVHFFKRGVNNFVNR